MMVSQRSAGGGAQECEARERRAWERSSMAVEMSSPIPWISTTTARNCSAERFKLEYVWQGFLYVVG